MKRKQENEFIKDCIEWDVTNWAKALAFWKSKVKLENANYECLELGSRSGGLSLWLSELGNNVICSDLENPEKIARMRHEKYNIRNPIRYLAVDATSIPFEKQFDVIIFKSILGGIGRSNNTHLTRLVIDEIHKALKPTGKLLFAENLEATAFHRFIRKKYTRWAAYWHYLRIQEIEALFEPFEHVEYDTAGFMAAFGRTEKQRDILGKLDTLLFDKTLTNRMKYIVYGVATKGME